MSDDVITFEIDGPAERGGNISADVFLSKLKKFISTLYSFDRAFSNKPKSQIELEIISVTKSSPATVRMRPISKEQTYPTDASVAWAFDQFNKIRNNEPVDAKIPQKVIDNVIDLASYRQRKESTISLLRASYGTSIANFDKSMETAALAIRAQNMVNEKMLWKAGISKGSVFGELRGVTDLDGERAFYVIPPSGPSKIHCLFPEGLRHAMNESLFKLVKVTGFLRYDGETPFPAIVEAESVNGISETPAFHFSSLYGAFKGLEVTPNTEI